MYQEVVVEGVLMIKGVGCGPHLLKNGGLYLVRYWG